MIWVIRNTIKILYSWLPPFYFKCSRNSVSCHVQWRTRNVVNTVGYLLVLPGWPFVRLSWILVALPGLPVTKQETTGFGQHLEVATGSSASQLDWMQFGPICLPSTFFVSKFRWNWTKQLCCYSTLFVFIVVPLFPGIWHQHDILLWNASFNPSCIVQHVSFNQLMQSFKSELLKLIVNFFKSRVKYLNKICSLKLTVR
jgi:hypothetical protein